MNYKTLIIDCGEGMHVGVLADGQEFFYDDNNAKKQSDSLLEKIDEILKNTKIKIGELDVIAVGVGPGSFTGIRVAIATAKGLAKATKAKIVTFNSFETIKNLPQNNYSVVVEGFGDNNYYFVKKYGRTFLGCAQTEKIKELVAGLDVYSISDKVFHTFGDIGCNLSEYSVKNAVIEKIEHQKFILTNQIAPLYLRASQAELERAKHD